MKNIAKSLRAQYPPEELYLLLAKRNSGSFTYDGIERGGERVCAEIEEEMKAIEEQGGKIKKLSIVGYSLGGLVSRYAVGLLYAKGILDTVECMVRVSVLQLVARGIDQAYSELHNLCVPPSGCAKPSERMAQSRLECTGRADTVHVGTTALHH